MVVITNRKLPRMKNWLLALLSIWITACQPAITADQNPAPTKFDHIKDLEAKKLLQKAIVRAGGLTNWENLSDLAFQKYTALYDENGNMEVEMDQHHAYHFAAPPKIDISWQKEDHHYELNQNDTGIQQTINGQTDTTVNTQTLKSNILAATFVMSIPFKLLDPGVALQYQGRDTLEDDTIVEVLQAKYTPVSFKNHSTPDTWWHYFSIEDYREIGYMVQHADHFSYVRNLGFEEVNGFLFPTKRESFRVDANRNKLYLRATYRYSNYQSK